MTCLSVFNHFVGLALNIRSKIWRRFLFEISLEIYLKLLKLSLLKTAKFGDEGVFLCPFNSFSSKCSKKVPFLVENVLF